MKKLIPLVILLGGAISGFSQGQVSFQNSVTFSTVDPTGGAHLVYKPGTVAFDPSSTGNGLTGTQYVSELYAGTTAGSLAPMTSTVSRFRSTTTTNRGKWAATGVNGVNDFVQLLPGMDPGTTVFLQVKAWDFSTSSTFEGNSGAFGASTIFTYKVPPLGDTTIPDFYMEGLSGFALVPEPSAIALGVMGIAGLFLVRRRKK